MSPSSETPPETPRLSAATWARVWVRVALSGALNAVPLNWAIKLRDRRVLLRVLRHRPIAGIGDFRVQGAGGVRLSAVESQIARRLFWYGEQGYEASVVAWWRRLCREASSVLEIGANIGYFTVQGAAVMGSSRYVAVEAHPGSVEITRRNVLLNELGHVDVVHGAVVGIRDSPTVQLALPDQERYAAPTGAYVSAGGEGVENRPATRAVQVPAIEMRELYDGQDLLKLDIEGHEYDVLASVKDRLITRRPTIVVEVLEHTPRLRALICELRDHGYLVLAIGSGTLHLLTSEELAADRPLARHGSRDVILLPSELADRL